jgi:hypothetical protein
MPKNPTEAARDSLMSLLDSSDKEGVVLQAAQTLLHHAGLFHTMEVVVVANELEALLSDFFYWLVEQKTVNKESWMTPEVVQDQIIEGYLKWRDGAEDII